MFYNLVDALHRGIPIIRELRGVLFLDDVRVKYQYQSLCRSLRRVAEETLTFVGLLEDVLELRRDHARKGRIYAELGSAVGGSQSDDSSSYPELFDFEAEFKARLEGVWNLRTRLAGLCQQVERESRAVAGTARDGLQTALRNIRLARTTTFGVVTCGVLLLTLGVVNKRVLYWYEPPVLALVFLSFGGVLAAWLDCCKYISTKHSYLQHDAVRGKEIICDVECISSEMNKLGVSGESYSAESCVIVQENALLSEVEASLDQFFTTEVDEKNITTSKAELEDVISSLESMCM